MTQAKQKKICRLRNLTNVRTVALFVLAGFLNSTIAWSAPAIPGAQENISVPSTSDVRIPEEFGVVEEVYQAPNSSGNSPMVIYIQDAHCIYEAQTNIRKIIDKVQKDNDLKLVAVEGGEGKIDPTLFRTFPIQEVKEKVIDRYVQRGELSGADYAAIVNEKESDFYGIEDMGLYDENKTAFLKAIDEKRRVDMKLDDIERFLHKMKEDIYTPELKKLFAKTDDYERERLNLIDYVKYLKSYGPISAADYPMLNALLQAVEREQSMDPKKVDEEAALLEREIERALKTSDADGFRDFQDKFTSFRRGEVKRETFIPWLMSKAKDAGVLEESKCPAMSDYLHHVGEMEKIKGEPLFKEIDLLTQSIKEKLFQNDRQRELDRFFHNIKILRNLSKLELSREELAQYREHQEDYAEKKFWDFIGRVPGPLELDELFDPHRGFYEAALKRDAALHQNLMKLLNNQNRKFAMVITGGFHSNGIKEMLKRDGISYMLIVPRITYFSDTTPYWDVMQGKVSYARFVKKETLAPEEPMNQPAFEQGASAELMNAAPAYARGASLGAAQTAVLTEWKISAGQKWAGLIDKMFGSSAVTTFKTSLQKFIDTIRSAVLGKVDAVDQSGASVQEASAELKKYFPSLPAELFEAPKAEELVTAASLGRTLSPKEARDISVLKTYLQNPGMSAEQINKQMENRKDQPRTDEQKARDILVLSVRAKGLIEPLTSTGNAREEIKEDLNNAVGALLKSYQAMQAQKLEGEEKERFNRLEALKKDVIAVYESIKARGLTPSIKDDDGIERVLDPVLNSALSTKLSGLNNLDKKTVLEDYDVQSSRALAAASLEAKLRQRSIDLLLGTPSSAARGASLGTVDAIASKLPEMSIEDIQKLAGDLQISEFIDRMDALNRAAKKFSEPKIADLDLPEFQQSIVNLASDWAQQAKEAAAGIAQPERGQTAVKDYLTHSARLDKLVKLTPLLVDNPSAFFKMKEEIDALIGFVEAYHGIVAKDYTDNGTISQSVFEKAVNYLFQSARSKPEEGISSAIDLSLVTLPVGRANSLRSLKMGNRLKDRMMEEVKKLTAENENNNFPAQLRMQEMEGSSQAFSGTRLVILGMNRDQINELLNTAFERVKTELQVEFDLTGEELNSLRSYAGHAQIGGEELKKNIKDLLDKNQGREANKKLEDEIVVKLKEVTAKAQVQETVFQSSGVFDEAQLDKPPPGMSKYELRLALLDAENKYVPQNDADTGRLPRPSHDIGRVTGRQTSARQYGEGLEKIKQLLNLSQDSLKEKDSETARKSLDIIQRDYARTQGILDLLTIKSLKDIRYPRSYKLSSIQKVVAADENGSLDALLARMNQSAANPVFNPSEQDEFKTAVVNTPKGFYMTKQGDEIGLIYRVNGKLKLADFSELDKFNAMNALYSPDVRDSLYHNILNSFHQLAQKYDAKNGLTQEQHQEFLAEINSAIQDTEVTFDHDIPLRTANGSKITIMVTRDGRTVATTDILTGDKAVVKDLMFQYTEKLNGARVPLYLDKTNGKTYAAKNFQSLSAKNQASLTPLLGATGSTQTSDLATDLIDENGRVIDVKAHFEEMGKLNGVQKKVSRFRGRVMEVADISKYYQAKSAFEKLKNNALMTLRAQYFENMKDLALLTSEEKTFLKDEMKPLVDLVAAKDYQGLRNRVDPLLKGGPGSAARDEKFKSFVRLLQDMIVTERLGKQVAAKKLGDVFFLSPEGLLGEDLTPAEIGEEAGSRFNFQLMNQVNINFAGNRNRVEEFLSELVPAEEFENYYQVMDLKKKAAARTVQQINEAAPAVEKVRLTNPLAASAAEKSPEVSLSQAKINRETARMASQVTQEVRPVSVEAVSDAMASALDQELSESGISAEYRALVAQLALPGADAKRADPELVRILRSASDLWAGFLSFVNNLLGSFLSAYERITNQIKDRKDAQFAIETALPTVLAQEIGKGFPSLTIKDHISFLENKPGRRMANEEISFVMNEMDVTDKNEQIQILNQALKNGGYSTATALQLVQDMADGRELDGISFNDLKQFRQNPSLEDRQKDRRLFEYFMDRNIRGTDRQDVLSRAITEIGLRGVPGQSLAPVTGASLGAQAPMTPAENQRIDAEMRQIFAKNVSEESLSYGGDPVIRISSSGIDKRALLPSLRNISLVQAKPKPNSERAFRVDGYLDTISFSDAAVMWRDKFAPAEIEQVVTYLAQNGVSRNAVQDYLNAPDRTQARNDFYAKYGVDMIQIATRLNAISSDTNLLRLSWILPTDRPIDSQQNMNEAFQRMIPGLIEVLAIDQNTLANLALTKRSLDEVGQELPQNPRYLWATHVVGIADEISQIRGLVYARKEAEANARLNALIQEVRRLNPSNIDSEFAAKYGFPNFSVVIRSAVVEIQQQIAAMKAEGKKIEEAGKSAALQIFNNISAGQYSLVEGSRQFDSVLDRVGKNDPQVNAAITRARNFLDQMAINASGVTFRQAKDLFIQSKLSTQQLGMYRASIGKLTSIGQLDSQTKDRTNLFVMQNLKLDPQEMGSRDLMLLILTQAIASREADVRQRAASAQPIQLNAGQTQTASLSNYSIYLGERNDASRAQLDIMPDGKAKISIPGKGDLTLSDGQSYTLGRTNFTQESPYISSNHLTITLKGNTINFSNISKVSPAFIQPVTGASLGRMDEVKKNEMIREFRKNNPGKGMMIVDGADILVSFSAVEAGIDLGLLAYRKNLDGTESLFPIGSKANEFAGTVRRSRQRQVLEFQKKYPSLVGAVKISDRVTLTYQEAQAAIKSGSVSFNLATQKLSIEGNTEEGFLKSTESVRESGLLNTGNLPNGYFPMLSNDEALRVAVILSAAIDNNPSINRRMQKKQDPASPAVTVFVSPNASFKVPLEGMYQTEGDVFQGISTDGAAALLKFDNNYFRVESNGRVTPLAARGASLGEARGDDRIRELERKVAEDKSDWNVRLTLISELLNRNLADDAVKVANEGKAVEPLLTPESGEFRRTMINMFRNKLEGKIRDALRQLAVENGMEAGTLENRFEINWNNLGGRINLLRTSSPVKTIASLGNLTHLESLTLGDSAVQDIRPLENLKNLNELNLRGSRVPDEAILDLLRSPDNPRQIRHSEWLRLAGLNRDGNLFRWEGTAELGAGSVTGASLGKEIQVAETLIARGIVDMYLFQTYRRLSEEIVDPEEAGMRTINQLTQTPSYRLISGVLKDNGITAEDIEIRQRIENILAERLDAMPEAEKTILRERAKANLEMGKRLISASQQAAMDKMSGMLKKLSPDEIELYLKQAIKETYPVYESPLMRAFGITETKFEAMVKAAMQLEKPFDEIEGYRNSFNREGAGAFQGTPMDQIVQTYMLGPGVLQGFDKNSADQIRSVKNALAATSSVIRQVAAHGASLGAQAPVDERTAYFDAVRAKVNEYFDLMSSPEKLNEVSEKLAALPEINPYSVLPILQSAGIPVQNLQDFVADLDAIRANQTQGVTALAPAIATTGSAALDLDTELLAAANNQMDGFKEARQAAIEDIFGPEVDAGLTVIRAEAEKSVTKTGSAINQYDAKTFEFRAQNLPGLLEEIKSIGPNGKVVIHLKAEELPAVNEILKALTKLNTQTGGRASEVMSKVKKVEHPEIRSEEIADFARKAARLGSGFIFVSPDQASSMQTAKIGNKLSADVVSLEKIKEASEFFNDFVDVMKVIPPGKEGDKLRGQLASQFADLGIQMEKGYFTVNLNTLIKNITAAFKAQMKAKVAA